MTTKLLTAPADLTEQAPQSDAAVTAPQGRRGFAAVALIAGGLGAVALALPSGPARLMLLLVFVMVGPGAAMMCYVRVRDRLVSWALAVTTGLTITCGVAVSMLWAHAWQPRVAITALVDVVVIMAAVRFVLDRWIAARPREFVRALLPGRALPPGLATPSGGSAATSAVVAADAHIEAVDAAPAWRRRLGAALPIVLLAAAVALWVVAVTRFRPAEVGGYGLTAAIGVPFVAAVVLLTVAFAVELFGRARTAVLTVGLLAVSAVLHATVPLLYGNIEYAWTYKHLGVVDLIRDNGELLSSTDIYQQWPGFFAAMAMLSGVAGVDALAFAAWSSLTFALLNMLLLAALLRQFTTNRRVVVLGVLLFAVCMWVDAGYFSPQAFVYAMMLGFWLIVARWLMSSPTAAAPGAGRLTRARDVLLRGFPESAPRDRRTRVLAGLAATAVFTAITVSHQLSPFIMLLPAIPLAVLGVIRPRMLVVVWAVVVVAFVAPRLPSVAQEYGLFDFDLFSNAAGNADGLRTDAQRFSALVARCLAVGVWSVALFAVWRARRRLGTVLVPAVLGFAPFLTLAGQSYGGEAIYRVFAFSLPFAALLIAGMWIGVRRSAVVAVASGVVLALVSLATLQGLQGQLAVHRVPKADVEAARYFYDKAEPNSSLVLLAPNFPTKLTANYGSFNGGRAVDIALVDHPDFVNRLDGTRLPAIEEYVRNLGTAQSYLVVSTQMAVYTDYFGMLPAGAVDSVREALRRSPGWQLFYRGDGVVIYRRTPVS